MRQNTQHKLAALVSVTFIMVFGNSMLIPLFPQIQTALDIPFAKVGLIITYYSIAAAVCIPIFGFISDHIKRKIIIIIALLLYGIGGSMIGVMVLFMGDGISFTHILVGRVIQGMGAAGMSPIALTLVGDLFLTEERAKALGYIESVNILGKVVSPILGTALAAIIWFAPFFMFGIFIIPVLPAVILLIHEPDHKSKTPLKKYFSDLKKLFCLHRNFIWVSYLGGAVSFLFYLVS